MDVTIVGVGKVGGALAIALSKAGYQVRQLIVRDRKVAAKAAKLIGPGVRVEKWTSVRAIESDLVLVCTADPEIASAANDIAIFARPGQIILHASGSLTSKILNPLTTIGCETGSVHPLVSVSDAILGANLLAGAYFCVEGSKRAIATARKLVRDLAGIPFTIATEKKALYHASAVMVAGHVVALFDSGIEMLVNFGVDRRMAHKILFPLTKSTIENLSTQTTGKALTGPFARLDVEALERHVEALIGVPRELSDIYFDLGERSLALLGCSGVADPRIDEMRRMIFVAKAKGR